MAGVVGGLLTSAVVKIAGDKLSSAITQQANLAWNFSDDLEDMKDTMESIAAVFKDAEKRSVQEESVRLWLKRLKYAAFEISDMMDDCQDTGTGSPANKIVMANKMKNMREKLRKIDEQGQQFNRTPSTTARQDQQTYDERETTSDVDEARILGRDAEKKEIIDILSASHRKDGTMVLPIYGLGGMGKSTMVGLVYNDNQFIKQYDHSVWVFVSEVLDLKKIGRSIISQLPTDGGHQNLDTLQMINKRLEELLPAGKKILIILDDIWQEDDSELDKLKRMLHKLHKKGAMVDVLVTTRSESIANKICTNYSYKLQPLAHNVCWDIIKRYSGFEGKSNKQKLEEIGLDIAKKCGGVALAARALGYMLNKEENLDGWSKVNQSDIWNESFGDDGKLPYKKVLPSLKLSYEQMAPILRLCFSYCAIFPKGHDIDEDDLVHQWIALDFIKEPSDGKKYIKQLLGMSFLQYSKLPTISREDVTRYTMHDLVHDLARSVVGDELIVIDAAGKIKTSEEKYCQYALLINYNGQRKLSDILAKNVRALHFSSSSKLGPCDGSFSFAKHLRILDFSECSGIILPSYIGQLKQLKCLIAPELQNKNLPESIVELSKLQYLNLRGSCLISALPESIDKLSCLIYLGLSGCSSILKVPCPFGELKSLVHLDMSNCSGITGLPSSLGNMTKLQHLDLSRCSGVKEIPESSGGLNQLQHLNLSYCDSITRLPEAIGDLNSLQYLDLKFNRQIRELPRSFQNLQKLVHLDLSGCCAEGLPEALRALTSLEHLNMLDFEIDDWPPLSDAMGNLTNLKYLNLGDSDLDYCVDFMGSVDFMGNLTNLEHLYLFGNSDIESLPECIGNLKKLQTLDISACTELKSLPDSIGNLKMLHTLNLSWCTYLKSLPDSIGNLKMLHTLDLSSCTDLESLPDSISKITALKSVLIDECSDELKDLAFSKFPYSLTLPLFKVRSDVVSTCSNLPLLEGTNVGVLRIRSLENVMSVEEARKVKLLDKDKLSDLTLAWTSGNAHRFVDDEDLLGQLVPPSGLKSLHLEGCSGQRFPSWFMDISHHLPNLVNIALDTLPKFNNLPPLGRLPYLEVLSVSDCDSVKKIGKDFCGGKGAFRRLSRFNLSSMLRLDEWCTTYSVEDGVEEFMFPVLDELVIEKCPRLRLTRCAPVCRDCTIMSSDEIISSLEELGNNIGHLTPSTPTTKLMIALCTSKSLRLFHHFTALQELKIQNCNNLTGLPESMRQLTSLQSLKLGYCDGISALPEWLGDLSSLKSLSLFCFRSIKSLPPCIQQLTNLQELRIEFIPELKRWCESEENKKNLAHINNIICECCD